MKGILESPTGAFCICRRECILISVRFIPYGYLRKGSTHFD